MKKILISMLCLLVSLISFSQEKHLIEGNINIINQSSKSNYNITGYGLTAGYYYKTKLGYIGLSTTYEFSDFSTMYYAELHNNLIYPSTGIISKNIYFKPTLMPCYTITERLRYTPKLYVAFGYGTAQSDDYYYFGIQRFLHYGAGINPFVFDFKLFKNLAVSFEFGQFGFTILENTSNKNTSELLEVNLFDNVKGGIRLIF